MLTHSQARNIAEHLWGRGGTNATRTNRPGAFYFSCSGHGGFVIDGRCLTDQEREAILRYAKPDQAHEYFNPQSGKVYRLMHPFCTRQRSYRVPYSAQMRVIDIFTFEEDCAWSIPGVFAGIFTKGMNDADALDTFKRWYAKSNHELLKASEAIKARKLPSKEAVGID
jgi:hypothetical protein